MKVINLLNKIANGEEVPKKIKYKGDIWYLEQKFSNRLPYYKNGYNMDNLLTGEEEYYFSQSLNDEVEIIEEEKKPVISKLYINNELQYDLEEKKIPEKIDNSYYHLGQDQQNQLFKNTINEIIDYLESEVN